MKISRDWLGDFVEWTLTDPQAIADRMTCGMGEVEEFDEQGALLNGVVVGKIAKLGKHPGADRLSVCDVETDKGLKHVVCGGTNLREGMLIAFGHTGATVKAGGKELVTLVKMKIRGEESDGMICASEEIGIEHLYPARADQGARPIADLTDGGFQVGTPLKKALGLNDVIFHIDNHAITQRPDLFSHVGVARELVALGLAKWKKQPVEKPIVFPKTKLPFELKNGVPSLVPQYYGCLLDMAADAPTPEWMKRRLTATGWRSINLVVDVTNYVLMETGMPLHAFDAGDFKGTVHIRQAKAGEKITTLDKATRDLPEGAVVMSDDAGIFDLFGVMGGLRTSNKSSSKQIFVQAGVIAPSSVRRTVIAMGHRTDAATVYEKGVTMTTARTGLNRAVQLFLELNPAMKVAAAPLQWGKEESKKAISVPETLFSEVTGETIKTTEAKKILGDLGCTVKVSGKKLTVTPPAWRTDLRIKEDIVEEVARVHGYASIKPQMPAASITPPARDPRINMLRDALQDSCYIELLNLAFTSPATLRKCGFDPAACASIENPIGEELSLMRPSLLPSILATLAKETPKIEGTNLKVFEYGRIFTGKDQPMAFALAVSARTKPGIKEEPLLIAKADVTSAFGLIGYALTFSPTKDKLPPFAHAGRSASILHNGKAVGLLTEVQPMIAKAFDLQGRTAVALIDLEKLRDVAPTVKIASPLPAFPGIELDETLPLPASGFSDLLSIKKANELPGNEFLTDVRVVDLYADGTNRTATLRFTYRSANRTLTQEEVEKIHKGILNSLRKS